MIFKKIVHLLFCVFQTKLNNAVNIFCRLQEWIRNVQMIPGFSTRLGWERQWKSCMDNSQDWRSKNINVIELNCKVVKKSGNRPPPTPSPIPTSTPPFQVYLPFLAKNFVPPQVTQPHKVIKLCYIQIYKISQTLTHLTSNTFCF